MAVQDRDQTGVRSQWLQEPSDVRPRIARVGPHAAHPRLMQPRRRGHDQQPRPGDVFGYLPVGFDRLRHDGPGRHDRQLGPVGRGHQPVPARDDLGPELRHERAFRLIDWPGGEPQIHRAAVVGLHVIEAPAEDLRQFVHMGRLEHRQAGLAHPDERCEHRLMRAALGRQTEPRRGGATSRNRAFW